MTASLHIQTPAFRAGQHAGPSPIFVASMTALLAAWLAVVVALGSAGAFAVPPDQPAIGVAIAVAGPPLIFLALMAWSPAFRQQILAISPVWLAAVQGLRIIGSGFLLLYAFGHLPGLFAMPAGFGDTLVALLAPIVAVRLARDPSFVASPWHWRFHALGLLDFVAAIVTGLLVRDAIYLLPINGELTSPLGQLPLVIIPAFGVPLWIILHVAAFAQIRAARRAAGR